jgi:hypothetical protein
MTTTEMTFDHAIGVLMGVRDGSIDEARHIVTRDVCAELGVSDTDGRVGDWIAKGEYCGVEDAKLLADEWKRDNY